jgi:hypothetical protein
MPNNFLLNGVDKYYLSEDSYLIVAAAKIDSNRLFFSPVLELYSEESIVWSSKIANLQERSHSDHKDSQSIDFAAYFWESMNLLIIAGDNELAVVNLENGDIISRKGFYSFEASATLNYLAFLEFTAHLRLVIATTFSLIGIDATGKPNWEHEALQQLIKHTEISDSDKARVESYNLDSGPVHTEFFTIDVVSGQVTI